MRVRRVGRAAALGLALAAALAVPAGMAAPAAASAEEDARIAAASTTRLRPLGSPTVVVDGLRSPWSMVRLSRGSTLISERDSGRIRELTPTGRLRTLVTVAGVRHDGESGLLGLAVKRVDDRTWLYAYFTSSRDNRVVRYPLYGSPGALAVGDRQTVLSGIPKGPTHDGGRIAFGPDGYLYVTTGDAGSRGRAQDRDSLGGKVLRVGPAGTVPASNPFPGSPVYSLGHRNPQGIAWDADGRLHASEFGQNTWDEFNRIAKGKNYGWPVVEGIAERAGFTDPLRQWPTDEASPSGLVFLRGTFFMASLRGERVWAMDQQDDGVHAEDWMVGSYGRIRDVIGGPDGTLWVLTNNTDGRGTPRSGGDKILQFRLVADD